MIVAITITIIITIATAITITITIAITITITIAIAITITTFMKNQCPPPYRIGLGRFVKDSSIDCCSTLRIQT